VAPLYTILLIANVQAPVGYDEFSYSYRDVSGTKFHKSIGTPYGMGYAPGDVIGCLIHIPTRAVQAVTEHCYFSKELTKTLSKKDLKKNKRKLFKDGTKCTE
jgi:hypothetical protein